MEDKAYKASTIRASETEYFYVEGLGTTGYYGHKYNRNDDSCDTQEEAQRIARLMNLAFEQGVKYHAREMRKLLQIKGE